MVWPNPAGLQNTKSWVLKEVLGFCEVSDYQALVEDAQGQKFIFRNHIPPKITKEL